MGRLASAGDFEGGGLYTQYQRYPFFGWRAEWLIQRYGTAGKWLIAGCGWGYLVDELVKLGVDAWGIEAAAYATTKALAEVPNVASRIVLADATNRSQIAAARTTAGLTGNQRFSVLVTEDLLPMLSDAEASTAISEARRVATNIVHIVTALRPNEVAADSIATGQRSPVVTWKTMAQWKALAGVDTVLNAEGFLRRDDGTFAAEVL